MTTQDLTKAEVVERLKVFNEEYDLVHEEPVFGHYPPDLYFDNDADQDADLTQTALDYPADEYQRLAPVWGWLVLFILGGFGVVAILFFCTVFAPWMTRCYLQMKGC